MGSALTRKKRGFFKPMLPYNRSDLENNAYLWCVRNNIAIAPFAVLNSEPRKWWIDVRAKDKVKRSPYQYDDYQIWPKIFELYVFYFEKYS
jgi:hypothetical protein